MIIGKRPAAERGIFFAIWPRRTSDGLVAFEWLHWELIPSWGWGSDATYRYTRFVPDKLYDQGVRCGDARIRPLPGAQAALFATPPRFRSGGKAYETPPNPAKFCTNFRTNGPTPCHYPHCKWIDINGASRCNVDNLAFGDN